MMKILNSKKLVKSVFLILNFILLCGNSSSPPQEIRLGNNSSRSTYTIPFGQDPAKQANYLDMMQRLPSNFNCQLPEGSSELICELCNCVYENGNEPPEGRIAVNRVVYTRMMSGHYPRGLCDVVRQPSQFSWYNPGMSQKNRTLNVNQQVVQNCMQTSVDSAHFKGTWFASNYWNPSLASPDWASACRAPVNVGNHRFCTGGAYGVRPPTNFPVPETIQDATDYRGALLEYFLTIRPAFAISSPVEDFLKQKNEFKMKTNFSNEVQKMYANKRNPAIAKGDFNGDGKEDFVSILVKNKKHFMVFFISQIQGYTTKYKTIPDNDITYLSFVGKDKIKAGLPNNKSRDLVQLEVFMGPTDAYFVEANKVIKFKGQLKR